MELNKIVGLTIITHKYSMVIVVKTKYPETTPASFLLNLQDFT